MSLIIPYWLRPIRDDKHAGRRSESHAAGSSKKRMRPGLRIKVSFFHIFAERISLWKDWKGCLFWGELRSPMERSFILRLIIVSRNERGTIHFKPAHQVMGMSNVARKTPSACRATIIKQLF